MCVWRGGWNLQSAGHLRPTGQRGGQYPLTVQVKLLLYIRDILPHRHNVSETLSVDGQKAFKILKFTSWSFNNSV